MSRITHVYIICYHADVHLARIAVASIRYWYADLPIYIIKDESRQRFRTDDMEQYWGVTVHNPVRRTTGMLTKLQVFFSEMKGRALFLDADIVLAGPVLEELERHSEDFLLSAECHPDPRTPYVLTHFYDWDRLAQFDPDFSYPNFGFNAGQFVWTLGSIKSEDFDRIIEWGSTFRLKYPEIFRCGDQGAMNYVVQSKLQKEEITIGKVDFARWALDPAVDAFSVASIARKEGYPFLVHWASPEAKFFLSGLRRSDLLKFYEDFYYSRIPAGEWRCFLRMLARIPAATQRWIRDMRNAASLGSKLRSLAKGNGCRTQASPDGA